MKVFTIFWNSKQIIGIQEDNRYRRNLLQRYQSNGPTEEDVQIINKRVIWKQNDLTENDIPHDATHAVKLNPDRCAINDTIFANHLAETHSKSIQFVLNLQKFI